MQIIWVMKKCGCYLIFNNNLPDSIAMARTTSTFMMTFPEKYLNQPHINIQNVKTLMSASEINVLKCCCAHLLFPSQSLRIEWYLWSDLAPTCIYTKGRRQLSLGAQSPEVLAMLSRQLLLISFTRVTWPLRLQRRGCCVQQTKFLFSFKHVPKINTY